VCEREGVREREGWCERGGKEREHEGEKEVKK
jgi:hypothetical protein